jgi:hypothetical protein
LVLLVSKIKFQSSLNFPLNRNVVLSSVFNNIKALICAGNQLHSFFLYRVIVTSCTQMSSGVDKTTQVFKFKFQRTET